MNMKSYSGFPALKLDYAHRTRILALNDNLEKS